MPARLLACPSCARHIRIDEARCPFCRETCPDAFAATPALAPPPRGLSRVGIFGFNALAAAGIVGGGAALTTSLSCSSGSTTMTQSAYGGPGIVYVEGGFGDSGPEGGHSTDAASDARDASPPSDATDGKE